MAKFFDITTVSPTLAIEDRKGRESFTVTNAVDASISGDAVIVPEPGTDEAWFTIDDPSRVYSVDESELISVDIEVPESAEPGTYGFKLRVILGGGVPEEQFDDSPVVSFIVPEPEPEPVEVPEPEKEEGGFPWWIVAAVGGVIALVVIAGALIFLLTRGDDGQVVLGSGSSGEIMAICTLPVEEGKTVLAVTDGCSDDLYRSMVLKSVPAGVTVNVYDSQVCSRSAHWTKVSVTEGRDEITVDSFESNVAAPPVAVTYHPVGRRGIVDFVAPEAIESRDSIRDVGEVRALLEDAAESGTDDLVLEFDPSIILDSDLLELARELEVNVWEWPQPDDSGGVDGRVSCVEISKG